MAGLASLYTVREIKVDGEVRAVVIVGRNGNCVITPVAASPKSYIDMIFGKGNRYRLRYPKA